MKKRELEAMRKQDTQALEIRLNELRDNLMKAQIDMSIGQEKNLAKARNIRRDIAQVKTLIAEGQKKTIIRDKEMEAK